MGIMDMIKSQLTKQVDKHGDKVAKGMNKAGDMVAKKAAKGRDRKDGHDIGGAGQGPKGPLP